jgi:protein-S-isoprenylcysteine O-methyltransferase Ste14
MTRSASTPRVRATLLVYLALVALAAVAGPAPLPGVLDMTARCVGLLLVATAVLGRIWCSSFIAGLKDAKLVRTGPYATCRHPLYSLSFVGAVGLAVASRSLTLGLVTIAAVAWLLRRAAHAEEAQLAARFPAEWPAFVATTPRWLPRLANYQPPAAIQVNVPVFWKSFVDGAAFWLLFALVDWAATSRVTGITPQWLSIP